MVLVLIALFSGFLLAGFSEAMTPIFGAVFLLAWYIRRDNHYLWAIIGLLIGTLIVLIAPGNAVRAAQLPPRMDVGFALSLATRESLRFVGEAFARQGLAQGLAFLLGYWCLPRRRIPHRLLTAVLTTGSALAVMIMSLTIPLIGTHALAPRHFTVSAFVLALTLFELGVLCGKPRPPSSSSLH